MAQTEHAARPLTSHRFMKGLHYGLPVVRVRICHERLLERLVVELLHIFGYLGKTAKSLFQPGEHKETHPVDVPEQARFPQMALAGKQEVLKRFRRC